MNTNLKNININDIIKKRELEVQMNIDLKNINIDNISKNRDLEIQDFFNDKPEKEFLNSKKIIKRSSKIDLLELLNNRKKETQTVKFLVPSECKNFHCFRCKKDFYFYYESEVITKLSQKELMDDISVWKKLIMKNVHKKISKIDKLLTNDKLKQLRKYLLL